MKNDEFEKIFYSGFFLQKTIIKNKKMMSSKNILKVIKKSSKWSISSISTLGFIGKYIY